MDRLKSIDDMIARPQRDVTHIPESLRRASEHPYLVSVVAAVAFGTMTAFIWTLTDYSFQWNNFVLRLLLVGGIAFGLFALIMAGISNSVDIADEIRRLRSREEQDAEDGG